jgi:4-amino-4-deoxy-L-arabinose transferase-like glycosyltransferase
VRLRAALRSLPLILLVALLLRAGFAWDYQAHRPHAALRAVPFLFESGNIAYSLARGHGFGSPLRIDTGPTAWMTPVYPLLLSAIMRVFGIYTFASWVAAVTMNIGFSSITCIPLYYAAKRVGGADLATGAAWLWAVFPNAILLSFQSLWDTSLSALLVTTALWATLRIADSARARAWAAYGLLWGLTLMTNAAALSLLPLFLGWAAWRTEKKSPAAAQNTALACGMIVLCCVPWIVRNYVVFHSFIPLRSTLGLQLWVGNNPGAKPIWLGENHPINDSAERQAYITMGEIPYMAEKSRDALRYMLTHPGHEAQLIAGRFVMLWAGGSLHPLDDFFGKTTAWFRFVLLFNLCAAAGALGAIVLLFRNRSIYALPLAAGPVVFPFAYYLTLALPRYRHPIDPTLMLLLALIIKSVPIKWAASRSGGKRPSSETG